MSSQSKKEDIISASFHTIWSAVEDESLPVVDHVRDFVTKHDAKATLTSIMDAVMPSVGLLVEGISDAFSSAPYVLLLEAGCGLAE